mmetsp:Transcript_1089/g.4420  ORF Transcript_1089/g.4420 Transcript_1089/m.4420 type:complete len:222 (-) Transcript_1089:261-926(-)
MIRVCQFMYAFPLLVSTVCRHLGGGVGSATSFARAYFTVGPFRGGSTPLVHATLAPSATGSGRSRSSALSQHCFVSGFHTHIRHDRIFAHASQHVDADVLRFCVPSTTTSPQNSACSMKSPASHDGPGESPPGESPPRGARDAGNSSKRSSRAARVAVTEPRDARASVSSPPSDPSSSSSSTSTISSTTSTSSTSSSPARARRGLRSSSSSPSRFRPNSPP